jgi:hypothetical protein
LTPQAHARRAGTAAKDERLFMRNGCDCRVGGLEGASMRNVFYIIGVIVVVIIILRLAGIA